MSVEMPFFMGMWRREFVSIGGYDEDFTGYAGEDNDLVNRLLQNRCRYLRVPAEILHLYHENACDAQTHYENPDWVYNKKMYDARFGQIVRNEGREWGTII